ncbi:hypothetical protein CANINC_001092 [Pichia inconspicua]|uniref:Uncharacterized protein n=1 Tax=Pichia inconspicua TaxID=52247 RepID=A0A4T0X4U2_9ASCO|nr:hypothetical protein CANINC_001092 [[Candida] inconspicua]
MTTATVNVSMDNILADISSDSIANKIHNTDHNDTMDTSLADYSVNTDADRTQPLVLTRQSLVNTMMPPVPDSPEPSPSASPKKVTFVNVKTESKDLPPIEHDLSVHSMPELGRKSSWDSDSDDSDLTLASPFPKRDNKADINEEEDVVVEDRVLLETTTVKNGMLVEHVVDLGIVESVDRVVEEPEKRLDEIIPDAESSVIEPEIIKEDTSSSSIIYTPVNTENIQTPEQQLNEDEFNDNPFLENCAPSGDTSISTFDSQNYVLNLPFDDSLYEPIENEADPFQKHSSITNVETSIFDIWNNQNVHTSQTSRFEFDCIKSPIKSGLKVAETKLNVKVLDKRIYSNSSSVIDRLE